MKKALTFLFSLILVWGCSSDDQFTQNSISSISLSPINSANSSVYVGDAVQLKVSHFPSYLAAPNIYWESSDFDKAVINESGLFTAKDTGVVYLCAYIANTSIADSIKVNIVNRIVTTNPGNSIGSGGNSSGGSGSTTTSSRCAATTKKGTRCKRTADKGSLYCWQHR